MGKLGSFVIKLEGTGFRFQQELELQHPSSGILSKLYVLIVARRDKVDVFAVNIDQTEPDRISANLRGKVIADPAKRAPLPDSSFFRRLCHRCENYSPRHKVCNAFQRSATHG